MGNSTSQWRAAIGHWSGGKLRYTTLCSNNVGYYWTKCDEQECNVRWCSLVILVALLVIGGVELNPGPQNEEIGKIDNGQQEASRLQEQIKRSKERATKAVNKADELKTMLQQYSFPPEAEKRLRIQEEEDRKEAETFQQEAEEAEATLNMLLLSVSEPESSGSCSSDSEYYYTKRKGTTGGLKGTYYECEFSALCALNGLEHEEFFLACNMDQCGAFDDIVFKCTTKSAKEKKTFFVQLKHKEDREKHHVGFNSLTNENDKFGIPKYYHSFINIRNVFKSETEPYGTTDPIFIGNDFGTSSFVLFTNASLHYPKDCPCKGGVCSVSSQGVIKDSGPAHQMGGHILNTAAEGNVYIFCKNRDICLYQNLLGNLSKFKEEEEESKENKQMVHDLSDKKQNENKWKYFKNLNEEDVQEFFQKFKLFSNQAPVEELDLIIQKKINSFSEGNSILTKHLHALFHMYVQKWCMKAGKSIYLTKKEVLNYLNCEKTEFFSR